MKDQSSVGPASATVSTTVAGTCAASAFVEHVGPLRCTWEKINSSVVADFVT